MAAPSPMRILRLIFCSRPQSDSSAMIVVNHCCIMITLASLMMSAIAGLYLLHGSPLLPSARSVVLISLPHVWRSLLSWITPPCLFVVLNCIIVTLTLTSGSFKGPSSAGSELYAYHVKKMDAVHRHVDYLPPPKVRKRPAHVVPVQAISRKELEKEEPVAVQDKRTENDDCDDNDGDDAVAMAAFDPAERAWHSQPASPSGKKQAAKCVRRAKSIDSSSMSTNRKHAIFRHGFRSSSSASASYTSSPPSSSAATSSSSYTLFTQSSPSFPSSPCSPNYGYSACTQFDPLHADDLSDDDLRKRIEAFISKMNAHIRREAATSAMEY